MMKSNNPPAKSFSIQIPDGMPDVEIIAIISTLMPRSAQGIHGVHGINLGEINLPTCQLFREIFALVPPLCTKLNVSEIQLNGRLLYTCTGLELETIFSRLAANIEKITIRPNVKMTREDLFLWIKSRKLTDIMTQQQFFKSNRQNANIYPDQKFPTP